MSVAETLSEAERSDLIAATHRLARERIAPIDFPILVMGRDGDHLQGIFRLSYELLRESGKEADWVTWDHPLHGYLFPASADGATAQVSSGRCSPGRTRFSAGTTSPAIGARFRGSCSSTLS